MTWSVDPEPGEEAERQALFQALERLLAEEELTGEGSYPGRWWRSGLDALGRPAAQQSWSEPGVVEP